MGISTVYYLSQTASEIATFASFNQMDDRVLNSSANYKSPLFQSRHLLFLIPTITGIALGILFLPHFSLGLAVGVGDFAFTIVTMALLDSQGMLRVHPDKNSKYSQNIARSLLFIALFGPIVEEGLFRGLIQPLLTKTIQILIPAAASSVFGSGLTIATLVSIIATAALFGVAHYFNPHQHAHIQAIACTLSGICLGILSAQFGIGAAIAAHVANNTIISAALALSGSFWTDDEDTTVRPHREFEIELLAQ